MLLALYIRCGGAAAETVGPWRAVSSSKSDEPAIELELGVVTRFALFASFGMRGAVGCVTAFCRCCCRSTCARYFRCGEGRPLGTVMLVPVFVLSTCFAFPICAILRALFELILIETERS